MENKKESASREMGLCKYPEGMAFGMKSYNLNLLQYFGFTSGRGQREIADESEYKVDLEKRRMRVNGQSNRDIESNDENDTDEFRTNNSWPKYQLPKMKTWWTDESRTESTPFNV